MLFRRKSTTEPSEVPDFSFCPAGANGLRQWLHDLPSTDLSACIAALQQFAAELAASKASLEALRNCLEIAGDAIATTSRGLERQSANQQVSLKAIRKQLDFEALFGSLYLSVVELEQRSRNRVDDNYLLNAMRCLCRAVVASLQIYEAPPAGCWKNLHAIYQRALTDCNSESVIINITAAYKSIVSLHCAQTGQLSVQQISTLYESIKTAVAGVRITPDYHAQCYYYAPVDSDTAPERTYSDQTSTNTTVFYFDFSDMLETLTAMSVNPSIEKHLQRCFGPTTTRQFNRSNSNENLEICVGLSALHFYIAGQHSFASFSRRFSKGVIQPYKQFSSQPTVKNNNSDVWSSIYSSDWESAGFTDTGIREDIQSPVSNAIIETEYPTTIVNTLDTSPSGYQLIGNNLALQECKPGEVIGIKIPGSEHWHVGIVRWSRAGQGQRNLGIELLSPKPQPMGIKIVHSKMNTEFFPALLLPVLMTQAGQENIDDDYLLFPNLPLNGKSAAILISERSEQRIILEECLQKTGSIGCYRFTTAGKNC